MGLFNRLSTEEKAEQSLIKRNVERKRNIGCTTVAVVIAVAGFALIPRKSPYLVVVPIAAWLGAMIAQVAFEYIFEAYETFASEKRKAAQAKAIRDHRRQVEEAARRQQQKQEEERQQALQNAAKAQAAAYEEQKRIDDRKYLLTAISNVNLYSDVYPDAQPSDRMRLRQNIAKELNDILIKHPRAELAAILLREPDIRGAVIALDEKLRATGLNSAEAVQIHAALNVGS